MEIVIFGLVCFWSGAAALIARLCGWPVMPLAVLIGAFAAAVLCLVGALCQAAAIGFPDDRGIDIQAYFGGTFRLKNGTGGVEISH